MTLRITHRIIKRTSAIMADPKPSSPFSMANLLGCGAQIFRCLVQLRAWCYQRGIFKTHRFPCTIISIGNITSGGTGKTPMVLYIAQFLRRHGFRIVIISRGYKGRAEKKGGIVSDGQNILMTAKVAGDEPFMMATFLKDIPVLVGKNRVKSCHRALSLFSPDVILLDDGFQHWQLYRDFDIVLLDGARPLGNTFLLPRGSLRESPGALSRAHAIVFTRWHEDLPEPLSILPESARSKPVFTSRHIPYIHEVIAPSSVFSDLLDNNASNRLRGTLVFAFSGIADNKDFHHVLMDLECRIAGTMEFDDHHVYSPAELNTIGQKAAAVGAELLVTTQKDFSKFPSEISWSLPLVVMGVLPSFTDEKNDFDAFLKDAVEKRLNSPNSRG